MSQICVLIKLCTCCITLEKTGLWLVSQTNKPFHFSAPNCRETQIQNYFVGWWGPLKSPLHAGISREGCQWAKFRSYYYPLPTYQLVVLLTELWTANQNLNEWHIVIIWIFKTSMLTCPTTVHTLILASSISHASWVLQGRIWGLGLSFHKLSRKYSISSSARYCCCKSEGTEHYFCRRQHNHSFSFCYFLLCGISKSYRPTHYRCLPCLFKGDFVAFICHVFYFYCTFINGDLSASLRIFSAWQLG